MGNHNKKLSGTSLCWTIHKRNQNKGNLPNERFFETLPCGKTLQWKEGLDCCYRDGYRDAPHLKTKHNV